MHGQPIIKDKIFSLCHNVITEFHTVFLKHSPKLTSGHSTATVRRSDGLADGNVQIQFHSELLLKPGTIRTDTSPPFVSSAFKYFEFAKSLR
jgi:hypothetical protein